MKTQEFTAHQDIPSNILYADDDSDDHFFFEKVLATIPFHTKLTTVEDGELLMKYLFEHFDNLPDVLFLDYNMPRKSGAECLSEIKLNPKLKDLPVIIYSTYLHEEIADELFKAGAHFYIRKTDLVELKSALQFVFSLIVENKFIRPSRTQFIISGVTV
jgi:CheY-like chemotaxis protein